RPHRDRCMPNPARDREGWIECLSWVPSRLHVQFALLVAAVLGTGYFLWSFLAVRFIDLRQESAAATACISAHVADPAVCEHPGAWRNIRWNLIGTASFWPLPASATGCIRDGSFGVISYSRSCTPPTSVRILKRCARAQVFSLYRGFLGIH